MTSTNVKIRIDGQLLKDEENPKYLGIILDRQLTIRNHLVNRATKIRSRTNILYKIAGITWGAPVATLRTTTLELVYAVAEYRAPPSGIA